MLLQGFQSLKWGDRGGVVGIRLEEGEQPGTFIGQALRAFGQNVSVIQFDFNGQVTHGVKLRRPRPARKPRFFGRPRTTIIIHHREELVAVDSPQGEARWFTWSADFESVFICVNLWLKKSPDFIRRLAQIFTDFFHFTILRFMERCPFHPSRIGLRRFAGPISADQRKSAVHFLRFLCPFAANAGSAFESASACRAWLRSEARWFTWSADFESVFICVNLWLKQLPDLIRR